MPDNQCYNERQKCTSGGAYDNDQTYHRIRRNPLSGLFHKEKKRQYRIKAYSGDQGCNRTVHTAFAAVKTEPGVHAAHQIVSFQLEKESFSDNTELLKMKLNAALPADIAVTSLEIADERFVASLAVKSCTYTCRIATDPAAALFSRPYTCVVNESLDLESMQQAAQLLIGTHDFAAFSNGRTRKSTVRTVETIKINREDQLIQIQLTANSFLRHMPQLLAGTILTAGKEKKTDGTTLTLAGVESAAPACPSHAFTLTDVQLR